MMRTFLSPAPRVAIVNTFASPFSNAVATARTCYSGGGIVSSEDVEGGDRPAEQERLRRLEKRDALARDLYQAGHHTTLQHAHFQFTLENVSRQFIWSFLHSHPFYNSEQVSQRYVSVKAGAYAVPPLSGEALVVYERAVGRQIEAYRRLSEDLIPLVEAEYYRRFPARRGKEVWHKEVRKKAQEVARYALPVATFAHLYHTVSGVTLLRYYRLCEQFDAPLEQRAVLEAMVAELLKVDAGYRAILEEPIPFEDTLEARALAGLAAERGAFAPGRGSAARFRAEFDESLEGRTSKLVSHSPGNEETVARSVREVLGVGSGEMDDGTAIDWVMDPARNPYAALRLNLDTHSKMTRCLFHAHYTFRKRLSHTADSQDQRHRLTPASRPVLSAHLDDEPDYVTPTLVVQERAVERTYREAMEASWEALGRLRALGAESQFALYLLPNAACIRFTESADLLNLRHKHAMRLCYDAQEEIWRASLEEALQVREVDPRLGRWLLPPCSIRSRAQATPFCPEGRRYCGEPVWNYDIRDYSRVI
jgi:thymidylate synthase ThyX